MNSKSNSHHRGKLIFTSLAAATLGLIIMSPDMAKADTLVDSAAKKQGAQSSSLPASNNNQTAASTDSAVANNNPASPTSEAAASNETQLSTSPSSEAQDSNEPPAAGEETKGIITPRSILTASWGGLKIALDTATGILTIPGGTTTDPEVLYILFKNNDMYTSIKKIKITGPLKIFGNASYIFYYLSGLTEIEGLDQVDTSEVTEMGFMFFGCQNLSSLDLSSFKTAKVTVMINMFFNCTSLKTLNISSFQMAQMTDYYKSGMLSFLPKLSILVLGPNNYLQGTGLDATGVWLNVGNGTVDKPQGNKSWTSSQLMDNYSGSSDQDTYIRLGEAVTVHYLDEAGQKLVEDKILSGKFGDSYSSEPQDIAGYVLKTTPANAKGTFTDASQEVTYVYTNQVKVLAHYVDQDGKPIAGVTDETLSGKIGDPYPGSGVKDIKGYTLKTKPTGKFSSTETEVTYVYAKLVTVIAHYVDQDGKPISGITDEHLTGAIGDPYPDSAVKDIPGYTLKTKPTGKFSGTETEVTYVYTKNASVNPGGTAGRQPIVGGSVTVHYQDETGKQLAPDQILTGNVGEGYLTQEVALAGYKLTQRPANATGFYTANPQSVTYIYTKNVTGQAAVRRTVFHNSYLYDQNGGRKTGKYLMGKTIWTYGTKVIQGKKYYDLGQDNYVKATNVSGVKRKLRRNSYVYGKTAKKLQRKALKKGQKVRTYGAAVKIHRKLYYIVGKNQYVKKSNF